jgi:hypothetical protein
MTAAALPGADLVEKGAHDLERGIESVEALLVSLAAPRLRALGVHVPAETADPEMRLYRLLAAKHGDAAHSQYNALIRQIVSFQRALARAK